MSSWWFNSLWLSVAFLTIGSDHGLSPGPHQAIIWTNAGMLLTGPLGTNFSEILIAIHSFSFKQRYLKCRLENSGHFVLASMCWDALRLMWHLCNDVNHIVDGSVQDCSISSANALELLQSCTKPSDMCLKVVVIWSLLPLIWAPYSKKQSSWHASN